MLVQVSQSKMPPKPRKQLDSKRIQNSLRANILNLVSVIHIALRVLSCSLKFSAWSSCMSCYVVRLRGGHGGCSASDRFKKNAFRRRNKRHKRGAFFLLVCNECCLEFQIKVRRRWTRQQPNVSVHSIFHCVQPMRGNQRQHLF